MGAVCAGSYEAITNRTAMHQILPSTHPTEAWGGCQTSLPAVNLRLPPRFVFAGGVLEMSIRWSPFHVASSAARPLQCRCTQRVFYLHLTSFCLPLHDMSCCIRPPEVRQVRY